MSFIVILHAWNYDIVLLTLLTLTLILASLWTLFCRNSVFGYPRDFASFPCFLRNFIPHPLVGIWALLKH